ncbi:putative transmembrane protein [Toxoplasma gondii p89]|uniref:Putative transmembrane protein n=1 Tax=Toxoplasma gondii p89 TaxID=943119 RepID=A0A086J6A2_TOXGO|nr:putative transmembrane protein [Toxoplasma gondii p89]
MARGAGICFIILIVFTRICWRVWTAVIQARRRSARARRCKVLISRLLNFCFRRSYKEWRRFACFLSPCCVVGQRQTMSRAAKEVEEQREEEEEEQEDEEAQTRGRAAEEEQGAAEKPRCVRLDWRREA